MVYEFPELQGVMGRYYALEAGEPAAVADAIRDHYKPQGPSDAVPTDPVGIAVALADKLDTLVGFWAIDEKPTGSKDPFALRRAALGVVRIVLENGVRLKFSWLIELTQVLIQIAPIVHYLEWADRWLDESDWFDYYPYGDKLGHHGKRTFVEGLADQFFVSFLENTSKRPLKVSTEDAEAMLERILVNGAASEMDDILSYTGFGSYTDFGIRHSLKQYLTYTEEHVDGNRETFVSSHAQKAVDGGVRSIAERLAKHDGRSAPSTYDLPTAFELWNYFRALGANSALNSTLFDPNYGSYSAIIHDNTPVFVFEQNVWQNWVDYRTPVLSAFLQELRMDLLAFFADRLKQYLRDQGQRPDLIDAVFALGEDDLMLITRRVEALGAFLETEDGANLLSGYKRAANILKAEEKKDKRAFDGAVDSALLSAPAEKALYAAMNMATEAATAAIKAEDFAAAMSALASLRGPVDAFFDGEGSVMVNDDDAAVRENRLNLLNQMRAAIGAVADFGLIGG
jgi:hypothetical protein